MAGQRNINQATFLTERALYRAVTAADKSIPDGTDAADEMIPFIDLEIDPNSKTLQPDGTHKFVSTWSAHNAVLELYAILVGTSATLSVYVWGDPEKPAKQSDAVGKWCKLASFTITASTLLSLTNIPAGLYRVCVDAIVGAGATLTLNEQHTL